MQPATEEIQVEEIFEVTEGWRQQQSKGNKLTCKVVSFYLRSKYG
jgi:hypothetical protein